MVYRKRLSLFFLVCTLFALRLQAATRVIEVTSHGVTVKLAPAEDFGLANHSNSDLRHQFETLQGMGGELTVEHKERLVTVFDELQRRGLSTEADKQWLLAICLKQPFIPDMNIEIMPAERIRESASEVAQYVRDAGTGKHTDVPVLDTDSGVVIGFFVVNTAQASFSVQPGDQLPIKRTFRGSKFDLTGTKRIYAIRVVMTPNSTTGAKVNELDTGLQPIVEKGRLIATKDFQWTVEISSGFDGGTFALKATLYRFEDQKDFARCQAGDCSRASTDDIAIPDELITVTRKHPFIDSAKQIGSALKALFGWIGGIPPVIWAWIKLRDRLRDRRSARDSASDLNLHVSSIDTSQAAAGAAVAGAQIGASTSGVNEGRNTKDSDSVADKSTRQVP
jgi:hypothetical protein